MAEDRSYNKIQHPTEHFKEVLKNAKKKTLSG